MSHFEIISGNFETGFLHSIEATFSKFEMMGFSKLKLLP